MCSIISTNNPMMANKLIQLNQSRGTYSHSLAVFDSSRGIIDMSKRFGPFSAEFPLLEQNQRYIIHVQAPTGDEKARDMSAVHPSYFEYYAGKTGDCLLKGCSYLYHNGILKEPEIKKLQERHDVTASWDTYLLHHELIKNGFDCLSDIDGSFGCIFIKDNQFYVFTNDIVTLFFDESLNISSVEFENSHRFDPNVVYQIDFKKNEMIVVDTFTSKSSPYFFAG